MVLTNEQRSQMVSDILDMGLTFLSAALLGDPEDERGFAVAAEQMARMMLSTGAIAGFFKDEKLGRIYRSRELQPISKAIAIVREFCLGMLSDEEFHKNSGEWIDEQLAKISGKLAAFSEEESG